MILGVSIILGRLAIAPAIGFDADDTKMPDSMAFWRSPRNDAANCLYVQLRLLGYDESYDSFRKWVPDAQQTFSLQEMAKLARNLGFRLQTRKLTVSDLAKLGSPAILHFEGSGIDRGNFCVFLGITDSSVVLVEGPNVTRMQMQREEFRRNWTGYALVAQRSRPWWCWGRRAAAVLVIVGCGGWFLYRGREPWPLVVLYGSRRWLKRRRSMPCE
jgi:hypothetical protein